MQRTLLLAALVSCTPALADHLDHRELDATLHAPYKGRANGARTFTLSLSNPHADQVQNIPWRVEILSPSGRVIERWQGVRRTFRRPVAIRLDWAGGHLAPGLYQVRMQAGEGDERVMQNWTIAVGPVPTVTATPQQAAAAITALPYTVHYANLHSQTNHSDGGGALSACSGAQAPQSGAHGPAEAYAYAHKQGLDILMASEHNHMYDGSDGSDPAASPLRARALYQSGLAAAARYSAANPGFLALYGLEWGVINNGGHLNIFNSRELLEWEVDAKGELMGDTLTPKNDYAALYTLMRRRGWLGQFNHPSIKGQFEVNGAVLGYHPDGDEAMVLCEVLNTSAFSTNTTETETRRSDYEAACNKALEAGYHVAFSTNQDNHCANWGASYTNRTGVLIPTGTALTQDSFLEALRARRVFATMDKSSRLVLTANGRMMGERFVNSGPLKLEVQFTSSSGKKMSTVSLMEGVPGRGGTVSELAATPGVTVTPSPGEHFYYAKVIQDDGNMLWSAPIWVTHKAD